jgi:hypothetical protein
MRSLNDYEINELEVLQLSLAIAHQVNVNLHGKDAESNKVIRKWADRVQEALKDAQFEKEQLPFNS